MWLWLRISQAGRQAGRQAGPSADQACFLTAHVTRLKWDRIIAFPSIPLPPHLRQVPGCPHAGPGATDADVLGLPDIGPLEDEGVGLQCREGRGG